MPLMPISIERQHELAEHVASMLSEHMTASAATGQNQKQDERTLKSDTNYIWSG